MTEETLWFWPRLLRTDRRHFRSLEPQDPDIITLRELNRTREELVGERTRLVNRLRELLWRYYPQLNDLMGKMVRLWHLELWELAPSPDAAKRIRSSRVEKLLKLNRVRRIDAKGVLEMLRSEKINIKRRPRQAALSTSRLLLNA